MLHTSAFEDNRVVIFQSKRVHEERVDCWTQFSARFYRLLNGHGRRSPAMGAVNASMRRIFPKWQSPIRSRIRKPATRKYSFATLNGVKRHLMMRPPMIAFTAGLAMRAMPARVRKSIAAPDTTDASFQNPCHRNACGSTGYIDGCLRSVSQAPARYRARPS
jgi:hypothetical protein